MASNTGCSAPGEELITPRTSAVAVCCSSASFSSRLSRATFCLSRAFGGGAAARSRRLLAAPRAFCLAPLGLHGLAGWSTSRRHERKSIAAAAPVMIADFAPGWAAARELHQR
jgi:hypothetical protein